MSIGTTQTEQFGKTTAIPKKRSASVEKAVKKVAEDFKSNTLGTLVFFMITLTGIGELFNRMSVLWYAILFLLVGMLGLELFLSNEPLRLFLKKNKKEKYGDTNNN